MTKHKYVVVTCENVNSALTEACNKYASDGYALVEVMPLNLGQCVLFLEREEVVLTPQWLAQWPAHLAPIVAVDAPTEPKESADEQR
jgi:hypothetical protein